MSEIHEAEKKIRAVPGTVEEFVDIASFNEVGIINLVLIFLFIFQINT